MKPLKILFVNGNTTQVLDACEAHGVTVIGLEICIASFDRCKVVTDADVETLNKWFVEPVEAIPGHSFPPGCLTYWTDASDYERAVYGP